MSADLQHVVLPDALRVDLAGSQATRAGLELGDGGEMGRVVVRDGGDLLIVHGGPDMPAASLLPSALPADVTAVLLLAGDAVECHAVSGSSFRRVGLTVLPARADVFDRVRGLFESDLLRDARVAVFGLGSGGSFVVRELTRCGVGSFLLLDHDRIEIGNACRHECGLSDVGRLKTNAMRDTRPRPESCGGGVHASSSDRRRYDPDGRGRARGAGHRARRLATDNRESRMLVNRVCILQEIPALYAGVFRRAYGGQVLRVIPELTPCYQCFVSGLPEMAAEREVSSAADAAGIAYSDRPVAVKPGLSSDIVPVALMMAKLAMLELLGERAGVFDSLRHDLVAPLYLWLNRREPDADYAHWTPMGIGVEELSVLRWYGVGLTRNERCAVCGTPVLEDAEAEDLDAAFFGQG